MNGSGSESERLRRLEESMLFAEHRLDQLHEHTLALARRVETVESRLAALERMLLAPDEPPPPRPRDAEPPA